MYSEVTSVYVPVKTPDYRFWAILLSIIVHVALFALIIFFHHDKVPPPMQTSLVTPEQLSDIQSQIKANQQNNASTDGDIAGAPSAITPMSDMLSNVPKPSQKPHSPTAGQTVNNDLATRQAQWEKEQALFAEKLDQEIAAERQGMIEQLNNQSETEQKNLRDYKIAENNLDDIKNEIRATNAAYEKNLNPKTTASNTAVKPLDLAKDGRSVGSGQSDSQSSGGNSTTRKGAAAGGNSANYISQVMAIIDSNWNVPTNSNGKSLIASFSVASDGSISNINIKNSSDEAFKASLKQAIMQSSPLPPPPNGARTLTGNFKAD